MILTIGSRNAPHIDKGVRPPKWIHDHGRVVVNRCQRSEKETISQALDKAQRRIDVICNAEPAAAPQGIVARKARHERSYARYICAKQHIIEIGSLDVNRLVRGIRPRSHDPIADNGVDIRKCKCGACT